MMFPNPEIRLLHSFCGLPFGATKADAVELFGMPEEVQHLEDDVLKNSSVVYHYWNEGFSLFFDNRRNESFSSVEIDNREAVLFDMKLFKLREKELVALLIDNGHRLSDTEVHQWGEKRLSFDSAGLDCYFENNKMVSVNFGIMETFNSFMLFPN
jgi:hypothetical protein